MTVELQNTKSEKDITTIKDLDELQVQARDNSKNLRALVSRKEELIERQKQLLNVEESEDSDEVLKKVTRELKSTEDLITVRRTRAAALIRKRQDFVAQREKKEQEKKTVESEELSRELHIPHLNERRQDLKDLLAGLEVETRQARLKASRNNPDIARVLNAWNRNVLAALQLVDRMPKLTTENDT